MTENIQSKVGDHQKSHKVCSCVEKLKNTGTQTSNNQRLQSAGDTIKSQNAFTLMLCFV